MVAKNWGIAKQVAAQQVSQEKAQSYNEAFKRIFSDEHDLWVLLQGAPFVLNKQCTCDSG